MTTVNCTAVSPSPSEAAETHKHTTREDTTSEANGAPPHLVTPISGGPGGRYYQAEKHDLQSGSSPSIVPDVPEDCATLSDNSECYWPSEAEIRGELLWARSLKQAEIDRFAERGIKASALYISGPVVVDQVVFRSNDQFESLALPSPASARRTGEPRPTHPGIEVIVDRSERNGLISALGPRQLGSRGGRRKPLTERLKHQPNTGPPEREDRKK